MNRTPLFLTFLLSVCVISCKNKNSTPLQDKKVIKQELNCAQFKTGVFTYDDKEYDGWTITRDAKNSIERNITTGEEIVSSIEWQDECSYILKYVSHKNISEEEIAKNDIHINIISTYGSTYFCEVKDSLNDFRLSVRKVGE